jgi:hypothetical protein
LSGIEVLIYETENNDMHPAGTGFIFNGNNNPGGRGVDITG